MNRDLSVWTSDDGGKDLVRRGFARDEGRDVPQRGLLSGGLGCQTARRVAFERVSG